MEKGVDNAGRHNTSDSKFLFVILHNSIANIRRQCHIKYMFGNRAISQVSSIKWKNISV